MAGMASVTYEHVTKRYQADTAAVNDLNLQVRDKEFMVLVGPSGCGKSTALRMLAGLEEITDGEIKIGERVVNDVPARERDIAMVFQSYALYPHMSVYDNMAFGLKMRGTPKAEIQSKVQNAGKMLGLEPFLQRKPRQLSGGQRQRVAMGRAIVRDPQVFLFDEPLSNLDAKLRVQMRTEIKELHQRLKTTSVYVTHDQIEAMTMADRIVVLQLGHVEQVGAPLDLYDRPVNLFVAGFIGSPAMNFIDATLRRADGSAAAVAADGTRLPVPPDVAGRDGQPIVYGIRPEHLEFVPAGQGLSVDVVVVEPTGAETLIVSRLAGTEIEAVFRERHRLNPGDRIGLAPQLGAVHVFEKATGQRLVA